MTLGMLVLEVSDKIGHFEVVEVWTSSAWALLVVAPLALLPRRWIAVAIALTWLGIWLLDAASYLFSPTNLPTYEFFFEAGPVYWILILAAASLPLAAALGLPRVITRVASSWRAIFDA